MMPRSGLRSQRVGGGADSGARVTLQEAPSAEADVGQAATRLDGAVLTVAITPREAGELALVLPFD